MIEKMVGIEYNTWMSVMDYIGIQLPTIASDYNLSGVVVQIAPSYPRDLTKFQKPAIIVQKVHSGKKSIGLGGVLGQYTDDDGTTYDVGGIDHNMIYQINIDADGNTSCSLLTDALCEGILTNDDGRMASIVLKNHMDPLKPEIGTIRVGHNIGITDLASNDNQDYINAVRIDLNIIQSVIDINQDMVDLSLPIKWTQSIRL